MALVIDSTAKGNYGKPLVPSKDESCSIPLPVLPLHPSPNIRNKRIRLTSTRFRITAGLPNCKAEVTFFSGNKIYVRYLYHVVNYLPLPAKILTGMIPVITRIRYNGMKKQPLCAAGWSRIIRFL